MDEQLPDIIIDGENACTGDVWKDLRDQTAENAGEDTDMALDSTANGMAKEHTLRRHWCWVEERWLAAWPEDYNYCPKRGEGLADEEKAQQL